MSLAIKQLKAYLRCVLVVVVISGAAVVLVMNRNHTVPVWFFGLTDPERPVNVVWLMLWTAAATRTAMWAFSFSRGLWRDMRELKRARAIEQVTRSHEQRTAELEERERRIDEKLKRTTVNNEDVGE